MRAAERLVRALAPSGHEVPIPEPLALDESRWLALAVEKGLLEFTCCPDTCPSAAGATSSACDHFETGSDDPHHLFARASQTRVALHREYLPAIAAYARAVLDLGYDTVGSVLLGPPSAAEFRDSDDFVQLQIVAKSDRQLTRRVATALDACGTYEALRPEIAREVRGVTVVKPRFLWLVGPNTVEPAGHVFRVATRHDQTTFTRVDAVPAPV
jgi:hypothetical protein